MTRYRNSVSGAERDFTEHVGYPWVEVEHDDELATDDEQPRTKAQLQAELDAAGVEYGSRATVAELEALLEQHSSGTA